MLALNPRNLNALSHNAAFGLIRRALEDGVQVRHVYLDTVGPPESYQKKLQQEFSDHPEISFTVCPKADSLYKCVSAASICAKVTRDHALQDWVFPEGIQDREFGCGYPSHPETVSWLTRNTDPVFGFPTLVRFSWETAKKKMNEGCAAVHF
jgi:ribonuclease H2 subunit A